MLAAADASLWCEAAMVIFMLAFDHKTIKFSLLYYHLPV